MRTKTKDLKALFLTLTAGFLLAACGQGESPDGPSTGLCEGICAKFELCDSSTDESDCVEECLDDQALSTSYWTGLANCVEDTSCDRMTSEMLNDCVGDEVSRYHSTSRTAQGACETMARALEVCNEDLDEAGVLSSCLQNTAAYFSDDLMNALEVCFFGSCDQITGCVLRTLDNYDADDLYDFFMLSLGISTGSSGGGSSGGENPTKEEICELSLDLLEDAISQNCLNEYWGCCWCICWRNRSWIDLETEDECYCSDPVEGEFGFEYTDGCTQENYEHSLEIIEDPVVREETAEYLLDQVCS